MDTYKYFEGRAKLDSSVYRIENSFNKLTNSGYFEAPFVLASPFYFELAGIRKSVYVAKLLVSFQSSSEKKSTEQEEIEGAFGIFIEDVEVGEEDGKVIKFDHEARMRLDLPASYEKKMYEAVSDGLAIDFFGSISTDNWIEKIEQDEEFKNYTLKVSDLKIHIGSCPENSWYSTNISQQANKLFEDLYVGQYGQVKQIVREFAESASRANVFLFMPSDDYVTRIRELLEEARVAFKEPTPDPDDAESHHSNLWRKTPYEFKIFAESKESIEAQKLIRQYDELWSHHNLDAVLTNRALNVGSNYDITVPLVDELENVAFSLLSIKPLWSPLLSKLLISALLYAETEAFARSMNSEKFSKSAAPAKVDGGVFAIIRFVAKAAIKDIGRLSLEAFYIAITYVVASALANQNEAAVWTITTGFTMWRWIKGLFSYVYVDKSSKSADLLHQMAAVHKLADGPSNPRLLRSELYRITGLGAVFSPWVFNLLDRQIELEENQSK